MLSCKTLVVQYTKMESQRLSLNSQFPSLCTLDMSHPKYLLLGKERLKVRARRSTGERHTQSVSAQGSKLRKKIRWHKGHQEATNHGTRSPRSPKNPFIIVVPLQNWHGFAPVPLHRRHGASFDRRSRCRAFQPLPAVEFLSKPRASASTVAAATTSPSAPGPAGRGSAPGAIASQKTLRTSAGPFTQGSTTRSLPLYT